MVGPGIVRAAIDTIAGLGPVAAADAGPADHADRTIRVADARRSTADARRPGCRISRRAIAWDQVDPCRRPPVRDACIRRYDRTRRRYTWRDPGPPGGDVRRDAKRRPDRQQRRPRGTHAP